MIVGFLKISERTRVGTGYTKTKFSTQGRFHFILFCTREMKIGTRIQGRKKGDKGYFYICSKECEGLSLDKEVTDMVHRQMAAYKEKKGNSVLG